MAPCCSQRRIHSRRSAPCLCPPTHGNIVFHGGSHRVIVFHQPSSFFISSFPNPCFSRPAGFFTRAWLPAPASPTGYAALIDVHGLKIPLPRVLTAVSPQNKSAASTEWCMLPARHSPGFLLSPKIAAFGIAGTMATCGKIASPSIASSIPKADSFNYSLQYTITSTDEACCVSL